jgi:phosphoribosyl 1,2-cyclic phosphodiesterase
LRFCALASGSRGNALLVEHDDTLIMVDCGLPLRSLRQRLSAAGRSLDDINALLITHEHGDHTNGIGPLRRQRELPVFTSAGTAGVVKRIERYERLRCGTEITIGSVKVEPFAVPHDAREPCQFVFDAGSVRLGILTDTGFATPIVRRKLENCDALAIEFNHDRSMLENGSYPEAVKDRVGSRFGHLNNEQAGGLLSELVHPGLQWAVALHISERNNSPELVREAGARATGNSGVEFILAAQHEPTEWIEVD